MTRPDRKQSLTSALDSLNHAREVAGHAISSAESPEVAFKIATELADAFRDAADRMADIRAREVARTRDAEGLSLAVLASRLNISKSRADQLIRAAAKAQRADPGA